MDGDRRAQLPCGFQLAAVSYTNAPYLNTLPSRTHSHALPVLKGINFNSFLTLELTESLLVGGGLFVFSFGFDLVRQHFLLG